MGLSCHAVVNGLKRRGHELYVLTSRAGDMNHKIEDGIARELWLEMSLQPVRNAVDFFVHRKRRERANLAALGRTMRKFEPDVVFVWGMWNLHPGLARSAELQSGNRVLYRFADYWPLLPSQIETYWREAGRTTVTRQLRRLFAPIALRMLAREDRPRPEFPYSYCVSRAVRIALTEGGVPIEDSAVIYTGFNLDPFLEIKEEARNADEILHRLLFIGRLVEEKGILVALEAVNRLYRRGTQVELTVVGEGDQAFRERLRNMLNRQAIDSHVRLLGRVPEREIPSLMQDHGIVVVPSIWKDPLPRVAVEGMAAARVVIGSDVGGLPEIITPGKTGFLFPPGNAGELASKIIELMSDPGRARKVAALAREHVRRKFDFPGSLDRIEEMLTSVAGSPSSIPMGSKFSSAEAVTSGGERAL